MASLLEVGTGFHPELTGRENIFLNGAILGMTRREVLTRFDQIVDFSGVEKFLDTPVKRYSVGMYARLAFSVAAHLETDILFVDEVLAVGDAEFQKRCLDRMSEVASAGRTVLFVSHNLAAVTALTRRGIVLKDGQLIFDGPVEAAVAHYSASLAKGKASRDWGRGRHSAIIAADLLDVHGMPTDAYEPGTPLRLRLKSMPDTLGLGFNMGNCATPTTCRSASTRPTHSLSGPCPASRAGMFARSICKPLFLASGDYSFDLTTVSPPAVVDHDVPNAILFHVATCSPGGIAYDFNQNQGDGVLALQLEGRLRIESKPPAAD